MTFKITSVVTCGLCTQISRSNNALDGGVARRFPYLVASARAPISSCISGIPPEMRFLSYV